MASLDLSGKGIFSILPQLVTDRNSHKGHEPGAAPPTNKRWLICGLRSVAGGAASSARGIVHRNVVLSVCPILFATQVRRKRLPFGSARQLPRSGVFHLCVIADPSSSVEKRKHRQRRRDRYQAPHRHGRYSRQGWPLGIAAFRYLRRWSVSCDPLLCLSQSGAS